MRAAEQEGEGEPDKPETGLRVLVVDDSAHSRKTLRSLVAAVPGVASVDAVGNGRLALQEVARSHPDLVLLDLQMPVMDGFAFLRLFRTRSTSPVLVVSSRSGLATVERALELGASGFISKPGDPYGDLRAIGDELRLKIEGIVSQKGPRSQERQQGAEGSPAAGSAFPVVAIGSSSGGPQTLQYLLSGLPERIEAAVLVTQHMPPGFTKGFAGRLSGLLRRPVREAQDREPVLPGEILIAPGGSSLTVEKGGPDGEEPRVVLEPLGGGLSLPSVDRLLETCSAVFGFRLTAVILTGMGRDGAAGVRAVKARGGRCIAESEETAAIFGMPREAAATGCVDEVLPLPKIAVRVMQLCGADRGVV